MDSGLEMPAKILAMSEAGQFPGLLVTAGMENCGRVWIHRPPEVKVEKAKKNLFGLSNNYFTSTDVAEPEVKQGKWEQITTLTGSKDWINAIDMSPSGEFVLAGSRAGSVHMWKSPSMGPFAGDWEQVINMKKAHEGDEFNAGKITCCMMEQQVSERSGGGGVKTRIRASDSNTFEPLLTPFAPSFLGAG